VRGDRYREATTATAGSRCNRMDGDARSYRTEALSGPLEAFAGTYRGWSLPPHMVDEAVGIYTVAAPMPLLRHVLWYWVANAGHDPANHIVPFQVEQLTPQLPTLTSASPTSHRTSYLLT
jgi:hypothetical protein